jgi:hypothetical protein
VRENLSLGVFIAEPKPRIMINVRASKEEGAKFSSRLLELAELV